MSAPPSTRYQVIQTVKDRLAMIQVARGFNTDAGLAIFLGEAVILGPADPAVAIAIAVGTDEPGSQGENVVAVFPWEIQALVSVTAKAPLLAIENVIADIKRAVELGADVDKWRNLGGLGIKNTFMRGQTRILDREPGSSDIGVGIGYRIMLQEAWGQP